MFRSAGCGDLIVNLYWYSYEVQYSDAGVLRAGAILDPRNVARLARLPRPRQAWHLQDTNANLHQNIVSSLPSVISSVLLTVTAPRACNNFLLYASTFLVRGPNDLMNRGCMSGKGFSNRNCLFIATFHPDVQISEEEAG